MRFVTYNIQYSLGKDGRYDLGRIAKAVKDADVIALQEVERHCKRSACADQPAELAALLPGHYWVYGPPVDLDASSKDSDGKVINRRRQFGNMLLSRWPIRSSRLHLLPKYGTLTKMNLQYGALETVVEAPAGPLRVYSLHLGYMMAAERLEQIAVLMARLRSAPEEGSPWSGPDPRKVEHWDLTEESPVVPREAILMGDFNLEPGSPEYEALAGPINVRGRRVDVLHRLVDSWTAAGHPEAEGITCPATPGQDDCRDLRIDYVFVTAGLAQAVRKAWIDKAAVGSDHQPYWVELAV